MSHARAPRDPASRKAALVTTPPKSRFERQDPPEIAGLRQVRREQPALAVAVDLQIDIATLQRRVQGRLTTPLIERDPEDLAATLRQGTPVLRFDDVAFDWMELRVLFRQMTDALLRHDTIEASDHAALQNLARASHPTADEVRRWFESRSRRGLPGARDDSAHGELFDQVLALGAQPFVARASEAIRSRTELSAWDRPYCPFCGGDPEMASLTPDGVRRLHCGRCTSAWEFDALACPFCDTRDERHRVASASPDGRYQLLACTACRRYLKALDVRGAGRPIMLAVDTVATLPLDAAAVRQGYSA